MALVGKVAELKADDTIIQNLIERVQTLENMPDEEKKQLIEYLHNFNITDQRLNELNNSQKQFHADTRRWLQALDQSIKRQQLLVDRQIINDIRHEVEVETGFNIRDYVTEEQRRIVTQAWAHLTEKQIQAAHQLDEINEQLSSTNTKIKNLESAINEDFDDIIKIVGTVVILAVVLSIPMYAIAFHYHPVLTSILLVLVIAFIIITWLLVLKKNGDQYNGN